MRSRSPPVARKLSFEAALDPTEDSQRPITPAKCGADDRKRKRDVEASQGPEAEECGELPPEKMPRAKGKAKAQPKPKAQGKAKAQPKPEAKGEAKAQPKPKAKGKAKAQQVKPDPELEAKASANVKMRELEAHDERGDPVQVPKPLNLDKKENVRKPRAVEPGASEKLYKDSLELTVMSCLDVMSQYVPCS